MMPANKDANNMFNPTPLPVFSQVVETLQEGIWMIDENDRTNFVNKKMCSIIEYSEEELMGKKIYHFMNDESGKKSLEQIERRKNGISEIHDAVFIAKSGKNVWVTIATNPVVDDEGKYMGAFAMMTDITESKRAEQEMIWLINNTEECFILLNYNLQIVSFNKLFKELYVRYLGIHVAKGHSILDYAQPERREAVKEMYKRVLEGKEEYDEITIPLANASEKNFAIKYKPAKNEQEEIIGVFVSVIDITEKRNLEKQKKFEDRDKEALINTTEDLMWTVSSDFKLIAANHAFINTLEKATGIILKTGDELLTGNTYPAEFLALWQGLYNKALKGESFVEEIYSPAWGNKPESWAETRFNPIYDGNIITGIACYTRDTTASKSFKNTLIDINRKLETAQQIAQLGYWELDIINDLFTFNDQFYTIFKTTAEKVGGYTMSSARYTGLFVHPDDRENVGKSIVETINSKDSPLNFKTEHRITYATGDVGYISVLFYNTKDNQGRNIKIFGVIQDITERKEAEEKIKEINERFEYVIKATSDAIWDRDLLNETVYWSEGFQTLFGYDLQEIKYSSWTKHIHPEDIDRVTKGAYEFVEGKEINWADEYRYLKKDQTYAYVINKAFVIRNEQGKAIRMVGAMQDITKRKNDEFALQQSEARNQAIINSQTNYVVRTDLMGNYSYCNQKFIDDFGWIHNSENLIGTSCMISIMDYHHQLVTDTVGKCFANLNKVFQVEIDKPRANGGIRNTLWDFICLTDSKGQPTEMQCAGIDISERKKAELAFIETMKEKNTILESIGDGFFAVDNEWIVTYWNRQAEKMLRKPKNEMLGHSLWEAFSFDSEDYIKYHQAIETNQPVHFEVNYQPLANWYEVSAYPSHSGLSVYFKDVTERKLSEISLKELNENIQQHAKKLIESNAELEQFAYVASHDLQEPLRMVTSYLTQLEKKYGNIIDDKGRQYIYFAVDGAKRMRQIILDLLEFSRVGRTESSIENIDLNDLVNEIKVLFRKQITEKNAVIYVDKLPQISSHISPLRQVFQNLIGNALKYTRNDKPVEIHITVTESESHWQFAIADNGIGIEKEYFDRIFIIFQRLHNKDEFAGTGLGLAVTKKIIDSLGGKIWVESEEGKGSIFYFTIQKNMQNESK